MEKIEWRYGEKISNIRFLAFKDTHISMYRYRC